MNTGVIGGADGPTAIYITAGINWYAAAALVMVAAVGIITWNLRRKSKGK